MNLQEARILATDLVSRLSPFCDRIEIAGSIRRCKPEVKDIEIIAIPKPFTNLFGETTWEVTDLDKILARMVKEKEMELIKGGSKYKQFRLPDGINLDLFCVTPPAQFGVLYTIRTGPMDFSRWVVTQKFMGGALPGTSYIRGGAVWEGGTRILDDDQEHLVWIGGDMVTMPEEIDFLDYCKLGWIEPERREAKWKR